MCEATASKSLEQLKLMRWQNMSYSSKISNHNNSLSAQVLLM